MTELDFDDLRVEHAEALFARSRLMTGELQVYSFAIKEVRTKLEILRDEIAHRESYNPIEHLSSRVKTPDSILGKMRRKGLPLSPASVQEHLTDIAGVRVTCSFISDTYRLHEMLAGQPDITVLQLKDYIAHPKPNGYRGLHAIVETPVHLSTGSRPVPVEIQFRTIAMDFWASNEHKIYYKYDKAVPASLLRELKDAAETAHQLDRRMQALHREIRGSGD